MDGYTVTLLLAILGSNATLWYKMGKIEQRLKDLNNSVNNSM